MTCYDLETGKQLWQREALPLLCEGQPEDKARAVQVAIDLVMAIRMWGANEGQPFALITLNGVKSAEGFQERAARISRMLAKQRPAVEKIGDPDLLTALDADLALTTSWEKTTHAVQTISDLTQKGKGPESRLSAVVEKKYGVPPTSTWSGHVGFSDSAPVSDGERVYAVFGQGQVALLGYADPPADYVVKNYLAEFNPLLFAGCYRGTPSYFGTDLAGVVPYENKLLIQSTAFLYCISLREGSGPHIGEK